LLLAYRDITDLLQGEHREILTGIGEKEAVGIKKALMSLKCGKRPKVSYAGPGM